MANLASVLTGFERLGCQVHMIDSPAEVQAAERLVLPGVGAFGAAMAALEERGLIQSLRARIEAGRPTLAICLGMQLLGRSSEESPGVRGLDIFCGAATCTPTTEPGIRVPQMGWNRVMPAAGCRVVPDGYAYFANSYRLSDCPSGWQPVWCDYGGRFLAALERDAIVGCQFHPELSGTFGKQLLRGWLAL